MQETKPWRKYSFTRPKKVRKEINKLDKEELISVIISDRDGRGTLPENISIEKLAFRYQKDPKQSLEREVYARCVRTNKRDKETGKIWLDQAGRYKIEIEG